MTGTIPTKPMEIAMAEFACKYIQAPYDRIERLLPRDFTGTRDDVWETQLVPGINHKLFDMPTSSVICPQHEQWVIYGWYIFPRRHDFFGGELRVKLNMNVVQTVPIVIARTQPGHMWYDVFQVVNIGPNSCIEFEVETTYQGDAYLYPLGIRARRSRVQQ